MPTLMFGVVSNDAGRVYQGSKTKINVANGEINLGERVCQQLGGDQKFAYLRFPGYMPIRNVVQILYTPSSAFGIDQI
jgi:hypothetical protein